MELSQQIIPWGQSAKFTCEVRGNPQPSVLWLRNAVPLSGSHRLRLSRRALRLLSVGPEDEGIYQCMAENEVGSAQAMVQLRTARPGKPLSPNSWLFSHSPTHRARTAEAGEGSCVVSEFGYHLITWTLLNLPRVRGTPERQGTLWFIAGEGGTFANTFLSGTAGSTTQGAYSSAVTTDWDGHLPCHDTLSSRSSTQPRARCPAGLSSASNTTFQGHCPKAALG